MLRIWHRPAASRHFATIALLVLCALSLSHSAAPPTATLIFHSTIDDAQAVSRPERGSGVASAATGSFDSAAGGIRSSAPGEHARWLTTDGQTRNWDPARGTFELLYVPAYDSRNTSGKYTIFANCTWATRGCWALTRFWYSGRLAVVFWRPEGGKPPIEENEIGASAFSWTAGQLLRLRVTWDLNVAPGQQNFHVYLNDAELPIQDFGGGISRGPRRPLPFASSSEWFYVGGRSTSTADSFNSAGGTLLDVRVWDSVVPPTPPGCPAQP